MMKSTVRKTILAVWIIFNVLATISGQNSGKSSPDSSKYYPIEKVYSGSETFNEDYSLHSTIVPDSSCSDRGFIVSVEELLINSFPGLLVSSNSGMPGTDFTLINRGNISLIGSNAPLIIVDDLIYYDDLSIINPDDVESITFLNDAYSAAMYGYEASKGALLITTKKAHPGDKFRLSYQTNLAYSTPGNLVDVYNGDEFRQIVSDHPDLYESSALESIGSSNTNWQEEILRNTFSQSHNLSFSGAPKNVPYRISLGYVNQNGVLKNTGQEKFIGSLNLHPSLFKDKLKIHINLKGLNASRNFGDVDAIGSAIFMDPTQAILDGNESSNGYYQWENYGAFLGTPNPVEQILEADNKSINQRFIAGIRFDYKLPVFKDSSKELKMSLNLGADHSRTKGHDNRPVTSPDILTNNKNGRLSDYSYIDKHDQLSFHLKFRKYFARTESEFSILAGFYYRYSSEESETYTTSIVDETYPEQIWSSSDSFNENIKLLLFSRFNYSIKDRYFLSGIIKREANTFINTANNTVSLLLAWNAKEEDILKDIQAISKMKFRLGFGPVNLDNNLNTTLDLTHSWEHIRSLTMGLDFGFIKDRITGTFAVYDISTNNALVIVNAPSSTDFSNSITLNGGIVENKGYNGSIFLKPVSQKNTDLTVGFHLSHNRNEVKRIYSDETRTIDMTVIGSVFSTSHQAYSVGDPAFSYFVNKQIYDANGTPIEGLYVDLSGEGDFVMGDYDDMYIYENPAPKYLMGLSCMFNYKNLEISFSSRVNYGNYVYNQLSAASSYDQLYQWGYWKNQPTSLSRTNFVSRQSTSDYYIEDASYFKLDHFSIGYTFESIPKLNRLSASFSIQNALTISNYSGQDPEVVDGLDYYNYPRPRIYSLGIKVDL